MAHVVADQPVHEHDMHEVVPACSGFHTVAVVVHDDLRHCYYAAVDVVHIGGHDQESALALPEFVLPSWNSLS